jgi:hypothetical protein
MKIIPFNYQTTSSVSNRRPTRPTEGADFQANLEAVSGRGPEILDKITNENHLACQGAAIEDVNSAGSLLSSLLGQIRTANPGSLQNVHNLDGILYYFQI